MPHSRFTTARAALGALALAALPLVLAARPAAAQINIGGANPLTYTQNFDSLPNEPVNTNLTFTK